MPENRDGIQIEPLADLVKQVRAIHGAIDDPVPKHEACEALLDELEAIQPVFHSDDEMISVCLLMDHVIEPQDALLQIRVKDEPGPGNAHHHYQFYVEPNEGNERGYKAEIHFQNGPIPANGVNGVTNEALLAVVMDRLRGFQSGPFACDANAHALVNVEQALHWLQQRTIQRRRRGVEGKNIV